MMSSSSIRVRSPWLSRIAVGVVLAVGVPLLSTGPASAGVDVSAVSRTRPTPAERRFLNRVLDAATESAIVDFDVDVTVADIVYGNAAVRMEVLKFGRQVCQRLNRNQRTGVTLAANFIFNEVTALIDWYVEAESYAEGEIAFLSMIAFIEAAEAAPARGGLCSNHARRGAQAYERAQAAISRYLGAILA